MMILKEPLKLKSLSPIICQTDGFFERMNANYQVLWVRFRPGDLFHLMSRPPELYISENRMATFVTQNQINPEIRLDMVHNLMNRFMMAGSTRLTYQDAVYIQSILGKLGIKNVAAFMKQLYEMQADIRNIRQLSKLYEMNATVLKRVIQDIKEQTFQEMSESKKTQESRKIRESKESRKNMVYWLHQEIFQRLRSADVYHAVAAFQKDAVAHYYQIEGREAGIAEQVRSAAILRLHALERQILREDYPLISHRMNLYEKGTGEAAYWEETILNELAGAVLLNLSDSFYQLRVNEMRGNRVSWYRFKGNLRQTLENTLNRFKAYHLQRTFVRRPKSYSSYQESQKVQLFHKPSEVFDREAVAEEIRKPVDARQNMENIYINRQIRTQKSLMERQIDSISNQVFRRLEKKLSDEKRRRGY